MSKLKFCGVHIIHDIAIELLSYLDRNTIQCMLLVNGELFNIVIPDVIKHLQVKINSNKSCLDNVPLHCDITDTNIKKNTKHLVVLLQDSEFENLLINIRNAYYTINRNMFNICDAIVFRYHLYKIGNPYINTLKIVDNNAQSSFKML